MESCGSPLGKLKVKEPPLKILGQSRWSDHYISKVDVSWVGEGREERIGDTYIDLSLANIFSFLQRNENKGREGHIFLLRIPEATLQCGAGRKDGVTIVLTFQPVGQGNAGSLTSVSQHE